MDNSNYMSEKWRALRDACVAAGSDFSFRMGIFLNLCDCEKNNVRENYIRDPKIPVKKYNRIMNLAYNHRKKRVRKKNLNRLAESQILIYAGWDFGNV